MDKKDIILEKLRTIRDDYDTADNLSDELDEVIDVIQNSTLCDFDGKRCCVIEKY